MPCRSDYLEPNEREQESVRVAGLLRYLLSSLKQNISEDIRKATNHLYGNVERLDEHTALLCKTCDSLTKEQENNFIYDGRNPDARKLADWWQHHQDVDKKRIKQEENAKKTATIRKKGLNKLTKEELEALEIELTKDEKLGL